MKWDAPNGISDLNGTRAGTLCHRRTPRRQLGIHKPKEFSLEHNLALNFHQNPIRTVTNTLMLIIISSLWYFIIASKTSQTRADFIGRNACGAWDTAQQERASADKSQFQPCEPYWRKQRADCPRLSSDSHGQHKYLQK